MISVCMATFNGEKYLKKQIDSILSQLDEDDELVISDDGSTDSTKDIIFSYNDKRIKYYIHLKNKRIDKIKKSKNFYYASSNFENALLHAKGQYIFLSDQDDVWKSDKISKMKKKLKDFDFVACNLQPVDNDLKPLKEKIFYSNPLSKYYIKNIIKPGTYGCCIAFNRNVLNTALPFPEFLISHDLWITCIAIKYYSICYIDEVLHLYRRTDDNVSSATSKSKNSIIYKIWYRLVFFVQFKRYMHSRKLVKK